MRTDMFQQSLEDLNGSTADIEASALISTDGLMIASALPQGMDEDRIGAMSAALLSLGERTARELSRGKLERVLIQGALAGCNSSSRQPTRRSSARKCTV